MGLRKILCAAAALCLSVTSVLPCTAHADELTETLDGIVKGYSRNCAVLLETAEGDLVYSHNPEMIFSGASLIKLPYAVWACRQIEAGEHSLDETITYTKSWYHGGSGIIRKGKYGTEYTIRQLLDYSLRYSDNVAYDMLVYLFGIDGFNEMLASWGSDVAIAEKTPRFPGLSADFAALSMQEMQQHCEDGEAWQVCWTALLESEDIIVRDYFPEETVLAVKYGEVSTVHHEVCYVYGDIPYILTIMTSITNSNPDEKFFQNVVEESMRIIPLYPETTPMPGDINYSGTVNASDAARVLIAAAEQGAGGSLGLTKRQETASDVSGDGEVNASDAALILQYAAVSGSGEEIPAEEYFASVEGV